MPQSKQFWTWAAMYESEDLQPEEPTDAVGTAPENAAGADARYDADRNTTRSLMSYSAAGSNVASSGIGQGSVHYNALSCRAGPCSPALPPECSWQSAFVVCSAQRLVALR
eukprot:279878-Chlamydomonas_euryale.AAC.7